MDCTYLSFKDSFDGSFFVFVILLYLIILKMSSIKLKNNKINFELIKQIKNKVVKIQKTKKK